MHTQNHIGDTVIHIAIRNNKHEMIVWGASPFMMKAFFNYLSKQFFKAIELLLAYGADLHTNNAEKQPPLAMAIYRCFCNTPEPNTTLGKFFLSNFHIKQYSHSLK